MKDIHKVIKAAAANEGAIKAMTVPELESGIASISSDLKGYGIGPLERLALNEERKAMRAELSRRALLDSVKEG